MNSEPISLGTTADGNLAGEAGRIGSSPAFFIPVMREKRSSNQRRAYVLERELFTALFIPHGE